MDLQLKDKVAVITGGTVGIGLAIARGLAAEGAHLVLCAVRLAPGMTARGGAVILHNASICPTQPLGYEPIYSGSRRPVPPAVMLH